MLWLRVEDCMGFDGKRDSIFMMWRSLERIIVALCLPFFPILWQAMVPGYFVIGEAFVKFSGEQ